MNSMQWAAAGLGCAVGALVCTAMSVKAEKREKDDEVWRKTVSDISESSSFPSSPQSSPSPPTISD